MINDLNKKLISRCFSGTKPTKVIHVNVTERSLERKKDPIQHTNRLIQRVKNIHS